MIRLSKARGDPQRTSISAGNHRRRQLMLLHLQRQIRERDDLNHETPPSLSRRRPRT